MDIVREAPDLLMSFSCLSPVLVDQGKTLSGKIHPMNGSNGGVADALPSCRCESMLVSLSGANLSIRSGHDVGNGSHVQRFDIGKV